MNNFEFEFLQKKHNEDLEFDDIGKKYSTTYNFIFIRKQNKL